MKKYTCILFDLDGTLTYSHPGIYACFRYALAKMGAPEPTEKELRPCVGPPLMYSFENFFGYSKEDAAKATAFYRERYAVEGIWENSPIPGAIDALKALKAAGYKLAMATSKPQFFAKQISERFGFAPYFDAEVGSGMDEKTLPTKASVIEECMRLLNARPSECLMVGDRKHDVEGAREHGVDCAMLKVGYAEDEEEFVSCSPAYVFADFEGLKKILL